MLYNMVNRKNKQSPNFIFDITECPLSEEELEKQIIGLYNSRHTRFIEKIILMKNGKILKIYDRKKESSSIHPVNHSEKGTMGTGNDLS